MKLFLFNCCNNLSVKQPFIQKINRILEIICNLFGRYSYSFFILTLVFQLHLQGREDHKIDKSNRGGSSKALRPPGVSALPKRAPNVSSNVLMNLPVTTSPFEGLFLKYDNFSNPSHGNTVLAPTTDLKELKESEENNNLDRFLNNYDGLKRLNYNQLNPQSAGCGRELAPDSAKSVIKPSLPENRKTNEEGVSQSEPQGNSHYLPVYDVRSEQISVRESFGEVGCISPPKSLISVNESVDFCFLRKKAKNLLDEKSERIEFAKSIANGKLNQKPFKFQIRNHEDMEDVSTHFQKTEFIFGNGNPQDFKVEISSNDLSRSTVYFLPRKNMFKLSDNENQKKLTVTLPNGEVLDYSHNGNLINDSILSVKHSRRGPPELEYRGSSMAIILQESKVIRNGEPDFQLSQYAIIKRSSKKDCKLNRSKLVTKDGNLRSDDEVTKIVNDNCNN